MDLNAIFITVTWELIKPQDTRKILILSAGKVNCDNEGPPEQVITYLVTARAVPALLFPL